MRDYRHAIGVPRSIVILIWLVGMFGFAPIQADNAPGKKQTQEDGLPLLPPRALSEQPPSAPAPSARSMASAPAPRPSHVGPLDQQTHHPKPSPYSGPLVSIIMDDLGYRLREGLRAIDLPGPMTFSIIPNTPYAHRLSELAHGLGKEILLHMPMEPQGKGHYLEPGGLTTRMTRAELTGSVHASIAAMPHARGVSNHMGSLLTRQEKPMRWLMEAIREHDTDLYFIDSRTTAGTVASATAIQYGIPSLQRDVFLDHRPNVDAIRAQFHRLIRKAKTRGTALGIAHPYPQTLDVLKTMLPRLEAQGLTLVFVSVLLAQQNRENYSR
uniref:Uncharacterized conserved protein YibQ, putative polysaccharide deacetylase 2 family n=1 Tax=Candidatus Kentrum sp. MB TaxID=2138164 RepID=A0A450XKX5_9GAMM|nr:MAG: Uncharacterized conserved protein YibQ, putative polysaccharide deacetylase 2 family [Candidatus Kentron sp. MB]